VCSLSPYARAVEASDGSDRTDWAMARFLIKAGADTRIADQDGLCPAEFAMISGNTGAVLAMLDAGMPPNARGVAGPLLWYCAWDDPALVKETNPAATARGGI
jgi:ankyrin repeat protein